MSRTDQMPIMPQAMPNYSGKGPVLYYEHPRSMPMSLFTSLQGKERCQRNHGQTPERLAERGGLGVREAACILLDKPYRELGTITPEEAIKFLEIALEGDKVLQGVDQDSD